MYVCVFWRDAQMAVHTCRIKAEPRKTLCLIYSKKTFCQIYGTHSQIRTTALSLFTHRIFMVHIHVCVKLCVCSQIHQRNKTGKMHAKLRAATLTCACTLTGDTPTYTYMNHDTHTDKRHPQRRTCSNTLHDTVRHAAGRPLQHGKRIRIRRDIRHSGPRRDAVQRVADNVGEDARNYMCGVRRRRKLAAF